MEAAKIMNEKKDKWNPQNGPQAEMINRHCDQMFYTGNSGRGRMNSIRKNFSTIIGGKGINFDGNSNTLKFKNGSIITVKYVGG